MSEEERVTLTINGREVSVPKGTLVVEAAKQAGIEIPVFCYHPKMKPVGACRMCLVEITGAPKLQTACTSPVGDGMVVQTTSPKAIDAQNSVIEFLLANHPLDCPVCDRGGQCPVGCNVNLTIRQNKIMRVLSRENTPVDDGWLCDRGRFTYEYVNDPERLTRPMVKMGGTLTPVTWPEAISYARDRLQETMVQ